MPGLRHFTFFSIFFLLSNSANAALIFPTSIQKKSQIRVCFLQQSLSWIEKPRVHFLPDWDISSEFDNSLKSLIQNAVTSTFTMEKIGVEFVGFEDCKNRIDADVVMIRDEYSVQRDWTTAAAIIGAPSKRATSIMLWDYAIQESLKWLKRPFIELAKKLNPHQVQELKKDLQSLEKRFLGRMIVQEFGHALALNDERFRSDCGQAMKEADLSPNEEKSTEEGKWTREHPFPYPNVGVAEGSCDPQSIMSSLSLTNMRYRFFDHAKCKYLQDPAQSTHDELPLCENTEKTWSLESNSGFLSDGDIEALEKYYKYRDLASAR